VSAKIRLVESTEPKIRLAPSTEPALDADAVAHALGAEPVGPPGPAAAFTFAAIRARVAALIARRGQATGPRAPMDLEPTLRASVDELTDALHAAGTPATPSEVAQALLEVSVELSHTDRSFRDLLAARLRERAARSGGQPS
jgi:hypothetical protein